MVWQGIAWLRASKASLQAAVGCVDRFSVVIPRLDRGIQSFLIFLDPVVKPRDDNYNITKK
ncbi:MAG: palindromic element RPE4 domain-containing protein [Rickettsia endosymbiont of Ecitomorpha arachnoides]|nr:palindromic element RPE4 domain-containing protein [Rickettsia endosymbiont of Ecitomorpha arachnoides]